MGGAVDDLFDSAGDVTGIQPAKLNNVVESVGDAFGEVAGAALDIGSGGALSGALATNRRKKAKQQERKLQQYKIARERRKQINEALRASAQAKNVAAGTGTTGGSAQIVGGQQPLGQAGSNIAHLNVLEQYNNRISLFQQQAANFDSQAATSQAVRQTAIQAAGLLI